MKSKQIDYLIKLQVINSRKIFTTANKLQQFSHVLATADHGQKQNRLFRCQKTKKYFRDERDKMNFFCGPKQICLQRVRGNGKEVLAGQ